MILSPVTGTISPSLFFIRKDSRTRSEVWAASPWEAADSTLGDYAEFLRARLVGVEPGQDEPIVGDPIGADGMQADLVREMIAYTPEELIAIGEREFAWCEAEMIRAAVEMGFGEDWRAALEHVKTLHVAPGEQPEVVSVSA